MFDHSSARVTGAQCSLMSYMSARFLTDSHTMPGQRHGQLTHTKLTLSLEKKNSPTSPAGIQACNLSIMSPVLYQQAIPAPRSATTFATSITPEICERVYSVSFQTLLAHTLLVSVSKVFLWNTTDPNNRRPCRRNWQRWPDWRNPTGLLESLWQGPTQASLVEAGFLWHQRQDHEMNWGLPLQQNAAGGSWRQTLLQRLSRLRHTLRLCPRAIPILDLYPQPSWWSQVQSAPLCQQRHSLLSNQDPTDSIQLQDNLRTLTSGKGGGWCPLM